MEPVDAEELENRCRCGEEEERKAAAILSEYDKFCRRYCGIPVEEDLTMSAKLSARIVSWKLDQRFREFFDADSKNNELMKGKTMLLPAGRSVVELDIMAPLGMEDV